MTAASDLVTTTAVVQAQTTEVVFWQQRSFIGNRHRRELLHSRYCLDWELDMPYASASSLLIVIGAFNAAAGLLWTIDHVHKGVSSKIIPRSRCLGLRDHDELNG
jgi:hypothetical protein